MFCSGCGAQMDAATRFCEKCGLPVTPAAPAAYAAQPGTTGPVYAGVPAQLRPPYAGFWLRLVAYFIDGLIVGIPTGIILVVFILLFGGSIMARIAMLSHDPNAMGQELIPFIFSLLSAYFVFFLIAIAISWLYFAKMESSERQATLGKGILNLKVTDLNGNRLTFGRATGRFFAKIVTNFIPFGIGWILAGFTEKKQALHDFIAGTLVWRKN